MKREREVDVHRYDGCWHIPCHRVCLVCGMFLPPSLDWIEQHVKLAADFQLNRYPGGVEVDKAGLEAAWVRGDSMIDRGINDGDLIIFQRHEFDHWDNATIVVIEKVGDEEGFGSWALKKIVIKPPTSPSQIEGQVPIYWNDPEIVLYSYNPRVKPYQLDPTGRYRVHGIHRRTIPAHEVTLVDSELIRSLARK